MISSTLGCIRTRVLSTMMLPPLDTNSSISSSIVSAKISHNSLSSGLGMDINIIHGRIRKILIQKQSRHIGNRPSGQVIYRRDAGTVCQTGMCEFSLLCSPWVSLLVLACVGIWNFPHFYVLGWNPSFFIKGDESCASTHIL